MQIAPGSLADSLELISQACVFLAAVLRFWRSDLSELLCMSQSSVRRKCGRFDLD